MTESAGPEPDDDHARALDTAERMLGFRLERVLGPEEIVDAFIHIAVYAGVARAVDSYAIAMEVFAE